MPTSGRFSSSAKSPQTSASTAFLGATRVVPGSSAAGARAWRALRSILPLGVSGMAASATKADGTM